jgi:hypothetical protein
MLQALGIALLCASPRPEDRPMMKDVAALLCGTESRQWGGGGGAARVVEAMKWADPILPSKLVALVKPVQAQALQ